MLGYAVLGDTGHALMTAAVISGRTGSQVLVGTDEAVRLTELRDQTGSRAIDVRSHTSPEADAYVVVADAADVLAVVSRHAGILSERPALLVAPGIGGSAAVHDWFDTWGLEAPALAETNANPFIGEVTGELVTIRGAKRGLLAGDLQPGDVPAAGIFGPALGELSAATAIEAGLANTNHVLHPAMTLTNLTRIVTAQPFTLFLEGMTPATERLVVATDNERADLASALSLPYSSALSWFERFYGDQGCTGATLVDAFAAFPAFAEASGPTTLQHRFLTDDVTCGLAVLESLGGLLDVPTPVTTATVTTLSIAAEVDLRSGAEVRARAALRHR